jgi:hypothetical protein
MDLKNLLEKMDQFAGQAVGQNPGDQWKGTDKAPPGKKLVGDSILKDLSKGKKGKSKEQELSEEFQAFLEAEFQDTVDKRPSRKGARHSRGHEPKSGYKTIKADESSMSEKDIELQDYRSMSHKEFQSAYGMTKTEWINKNKSLVITNPNIKKGLGLDEGAEQDPIVAKVVKQMRPGLTGLNMGNEAFLYFAYELGKQRARDAWEDYLPAIRAEYEKGLNEDKQEDDPVEARWMVKVSDDEGDHLKTYHRKFPNLSAAKKAYRNTPYASDFKYKPVKKDQVEEAVDSDIVQAMGQDSFNRAGYNPISDESDYLKKLSDLSNLSRKPGLDQQMKDQIKQRILDLNAEARKKGYIQAESRGHKILATKLKDVERAKKFASGELKIPTPQERRAELDKQKDKKEKVDQIDEISQKLAGDYLDKVTKQQVSKHGIQSNMYEKLPKNRQKGVSNAFNRLLVDPKEKVDEYGADNNVTPYGQPATDPKKAAQIAQGAQAFKAATGITAPATNIAKALDDASQGKPADRTSMKVLEPAMQDLITIMSDPKLGSEYKSLAQKVNQKQLKPQ